MKKTVLLKKMLVILLVISIVAINGCGQSGSLYLLPKDPAAKPSSMP